MKEKIIKELTDAIDEIFLEEQARSHVISGDISPSDSITLDKQIELIAEMIIKILKKQPKLEISHIWLNNKSYDANELANDYETFQALKTIQEKIEKGIADEKN